MSAQATVQQSAKAGRQHHHHRHGNQVPQGAPQLAVILRSKASVSCISPHVNPRPAASASSPSASPDAQSEKAEQNHMVLYSREGEYSAVAQSSDGSLLALACGQGLRVIRIRSGEELFFVPNRRVFDITFSPRGNFLCSWEHPFNSTKDNLMVFHVPTQTLVYSCFNKQQANALPVFFDDESEFALLQNASMIAFYDTAALVAAAQSALASESADSSEETESSNNNSGSANDGEFPSAESPKRDGKISPREYPGPCRVLRADDKTKFNVFSLSPSKPPLLAVFCTDKGQRPATIRLFPVDKLNQPPVAYQSLFAAEDVRFFWNPKGNSALVRCTTAVDKSGKSYYGDSRLIFVSSERDLCCHVHLDSDGPVYDVAWSPNSREFAVVYGLMPAKTAMFSIRCVKIAALGTAHRNTLRFSPNGRFLLIAGFGNLSGEMDFWDMVDYKHLGTAIAPNTTTVEWSPDGSRLLAATLFPRMRVDNGWSVWHYSGVCLDRGKVNDLFQVFWRNIPVSKQLQGQWARRELSPAPKSPFTDCRQVSTARYIPPSERAAAAAASAGGPAKIPGSALASTAATSYKRIPPGANFVESSGQNSTRQHSGRNEK